MFSNSAASRPLRMAATRPSIMSDGATISIPAFACETAVRARISKVGSLRISYSCVAPFAEVFFCTIPQWPCDMYSHRQTSPISSIPGTSLFNARAARWTMPSSAQAPVAVSSFVSGKPNKIRAFTPSAKASRASFTASSTERLNTPGMEPMGLRTPSPGQINKG